MFQRLQILLLSLLLFNVAQASFAQEIVLQQVISREHPDFDAARAMLSVGRDGKVYLGSIGPANTAYVLRTSLEGKDRFGGSVAYALNGVAANQDGVLATANGHFAHKVTLYDGQFQQAAEVTDFLVSDAVGYDAPAHVEVGASGDFYGLDKHRMRILRISADGKVLKAYSIPNEPEGNAGQIDNFRVSEKREAFYLVPRQGPLRVVGFDGKTRWTTPHRVSVSHLGLHGGYDVDVEGNLYVVGERASKVTVLSATGEPLRELELAIPKFAPSQQTREGTISGLRIAGEELVLKRWDSTQLFERYALRDGTFLAAVPSQHEQLSITYPSDVWTAGEKLSARIAFEAPNTKSAPQWSLWIRPLHEAGYRRLPLVDGKIEVPKDLGGICQIKVSPEVQSAERGLPSEYLLRGWVEVRAPGAQGSLSVLTPENRVYYARGEAIPLSVLVRVKDDKPVEVTLELISGELVLASAKETVSPGKVLPLTLPPELTKALRAGKYRLRASAANFTSVPQTIVLGSGTRPEPGFLRMRHGDYGATYPSANVWNVPDVVAAHVEREQKLGFNTFVDRIGTHTQIGALQWDGESQQQLQALRKRLADDPSAAAPETIEMVSPLVQVMAAYSAHDMQQMAILLYMDAGLPLGGPGFDHRKPEKMKEDLQTVTKALLSYSSFRGWSWHANWWIFDQRGAAAATSAEQKAAYEAAFKKAKETGAWSPVLEEVSQRRLSFATDAQDFFAKALREIDGQGRLKTASAGTYRNVESYPPISFRNVDEVDLQGQFEQIFLPYFPMHAVDFYRRPGKPVWGHPEIWNDAGTGEQVLPELFSMLMRSPQGLGPSGNVPPWTGTTGITDDARIAHFGTASVFRAWNGVLERYGAAISTWEPDDQIAIIGSGRQFKIDEWGHVMGIHFSRVMEAYVASMHAHHPASMVFVEDLKADTLNKYKAVLLVDQWVEMEPELAAALKTAQAAGTKVFYDGTSREPLMGGFTPLGISFDKFENDKHPASDDAAYYRFPRYVQQHLPKLKAALDGATKPAAIVENPEVWISQLKSDQGRYLFVVNNTTLPLEPGQMWRTTLFSASLLPVVEKVELTGSAPVVYDVFAMQQVALKNNGLTADLRSTPARLYAILPSAIERVTLRGPTKVAAGQAFGWQAQVNDANGKPIAASVPLRVRLRSADGGLLHEQYVTASAEGAKGSLTVPLNAAAGNVTLDVTDLFSGKQSRLEMEVARQELPLSLTAPKLAGASVSDAVGKMHVRDTDASDRQFGPHLRDLRILKDGKTAVISAMNWDHNLYGIDLATGEVTWRKKVGNYFAFAPQATGDGFTVQGFDYQSAEGYHLYQLSMTGDVQQRFALYGLPRRLPHRFVPALLNDRQHPVNNFATPRDGGWVASAGDLGLAVWDSSGKLLWKRDWWQDDRQPAHLAALGQDAVLVIKAMVATAYDAKTGEQQWQHKLAATGDVRKVATSSIGKIAAISTTTDGGRVFDLRGSDVALTLPAVAEDIYLSHGGSNIVTISGNQLQCFMSHTGLRWTFTGDDRLRNLRVMNDGDRIAVASELGTVYVLNFDGELEYERDNRALTVPAWTTDGDLVLANWMGNVTRLRGDDYRTMWSVDVRPADTDVRASLTAADNAPTARIADWGNAAKEPLPITSNLLADTKALVRFVAVGVPHLQLAHKPDALTDGRPEPPQEPWLEWGDVNGLAESNPETYLELDTFRTQLKVTAITLVEDAQHPDSWLRDAALDYWDAAAERWVTAQALLSDSAVHSHVLAKPIEAARFRVKIPKGFYGNLRLGEIVLHGEVLGASHPDVIAKRAVATLFDESEQFKDVYPYHDRWSFQLTGAASGGRFWQVNANQMIAPTFYPTFGHTVPTWDFDIVEDPQPGQYRWAQWSWKALSPDVKGATVQIAGLRLHAGVASGEDHLKPHKVADSVPAEWKTVRVDLWELLKQPTKIQTLYLGANGGPVGFDRILLGRSEAELDKAKEDK